MENFRVENLKFRYKTADCNALNNVSFSLEKGDFMVICGQSGSGKTTLLRLLKPEISPNGYKKGSIFYNGKEITEGNATTLKIGYVFQNPDNQIVSDRVYTELAFGLESMGLASDDIKIRVAEIAQYFNLTSLYNKRTSMLSGGEKQLLNLASIMAMNPEVLIFDEPTSQLDPIASKEFLQTVKRINEELNITVILTEHRIEEVFNLATKVMVLDKGNVFTVGTPEEVVNSEKLDSKLKLMLPTTARLFAEINGEKGMPKTIKEAREYLLNNVKITKTKLLKEQEVLQKEIAVEIKNACFRYDKNSKDIISDANLKIYKGEIFSIVGGNGVGKSTLLKTIVGSLNLYSGKIKYFSKNLKSFRNNQKYGTISMLSQNPATLFVKDKVITDLKEIEKLAGYSHIEFEKMLNDTISLVGIEDVLQSHPYDLSGGEMQKVALCKVLLMKPQILLLDEMTKGLDNFYKNKLGDILLKLKEKGITIIQVTHDVEFASKYSTRVGMMFNGDIIAVKDRTEFFKSNQFYTTSAVKISKGIYENTVNTDELIELTRLNADG